MLAAGPAQAQPAQAVHPQLSAESLRADLRFLTSDSFEGRATGDFGGGAAARYLESRFVRAGLEPLAGGFLQPFPAAPLHLDGELTELSWRDAGGAEQLWKPGDHLLPHPGAPAGAVAGDVVFAGYALELPELEYDDLYGLDLAGKIALILRWEPQAAQPDSRFLGRRLLPESRLAAKVRRCEELGAVAVLVAAPPGVQQEWKAPGALLWPPESLLWNSLNATVEMRADAAELAQTNFTARDVAAQVFCMLQTAAPLATSIPVAYVSTAVLEAAFAAAGRDARRWVRETDAAGAGDGFDLPLRASLRVAFAAPARTGSNVVGLLRGSDPVLAEEYVVLGAHYDHVGRNAEGVIWNGADDNGSGSVVLAALADSFAAGPRPKRSLAFVAFAAEEIGLLGSSWFLAQGLLPEQRVAAMVNMDMIGRAINGKVYVLGTKSSPILRPLVERCAAGLAVSCDFENEEFFERSDQFSFYMQGIPVLFFNTDEHADYHKPSDTWELIQYHSLADIAGLARRVAQSLGDLSQAPPFEDGYRCFRAAWDTPPKIVAPHAVPFVQRLDY